MGPRGPVKWTRQSRSLSRLLISYMSPCLCTAAKETFGWEEQAADAPRNSDRCSGVQRQQRVGNQKMEKNKRLLWNGKVECGGSIPLWRRPRCCAAANAATWPRSGSLSPSRRVRRFESKTNAPNPNVPDAGGGVGKAKRQRLVFSVEVDVPASHGFSRVNPSAP